MGNDNDRGLFRDGLDGLLDEALGTGVQSTMARARATRWICPPDNRTPRSPTSVS